MLLSILSLITKRRPSTMQSFVNLAEPCVEPKYRSINWCLYNVDMSFQMSSSETYSSPVRKEDYDRKSRTERRAKSRKGKRRVVLGGGKRTQKRTVILMAHFAPNLLDNEDNSCNKASTSKSHFPDF